MSRESDLFLAEVPDRLLIGMLRSVFDGCIAARAASKKHDKRWFGDRLPTERRLGVEPRLADLVLPPGFTVTLDQTNSSTNTRIQSDKVVITAVTRNARVRYVSPYRIRETLAQEAQCEMFENAQPRVGAKLFALMIYGGPHRAKFPTIATIKFPLPSGKFAPGSIDLLQRFPGVVTAYTEAESVAKPKVGLRPAKKESDEKVGS